MNIKLKLSLFICFILLINNVKVSAQGNKGYLTNDGTWCWFSDPRAIKVGDYIFTGWVKSNGTIEATKFNFKTLENDPSELYYLLENDDHDNPAFVPTGEGDILAMYTRHSRKDLFINVLEDYKNQSNYSKPQFIHPISKAELEKFPRETMTYANPFRLTAENDRIYCFGRWTGFKPNMMWSDDHGETWSQSKVFITNYPFDINNRPYVKYGSNGTSKIHVVFTDGHPRDEPTNSVYYAYYESGAFFKADGEKIRDTTALPFEPKEADLVFRSNEKEGRAWIADIASDKKDQPVILYTKSPSENNHEYWYASYRKGKWQSYKICDSGKWFPQTPEGKREYEPHYFGGMSLHPDNSHVVYLSREINGIFEIERWETDDLGKSWSTESITKNSVKDNVRPYVPRGLSADEAEMVFWMENEKYIHYTNFKTSIKYFIRK
ncbi:BNR-4 repeat-containing protein [Fulvivirga sediminis]|uniref:BNR-4 repeat-containing protein n=1 Tax=Fulvivirga sediminis TaxID=2803949 RepID=A0A937JX59_9BACT|nr:BNR-4 repeat-containing protein [Fulvivirga sediminis]MBL3655178.1 BNR-4 repeat-containing protein [Fulvivirga sediminis]